MDVNSLTISQLPGKIIRSDYSNNANKSMFQNMLINAMAESQSMIGLFENNFKSLSPDSSGEIEDFGLSLKASINHKIIIAMKSCMGLQIFSFSDQMQQLKKL